jgi:hypothetical protein
MSKIREIIREKFGYTKDIPAEIDLHKDVTDGKKLSPANHPLEPFRKAIKAILGVQQIDDPAKVEEAIKMVKLEQLAKKHSFSEEFIQAIGRIKEEIGKSKPNREEINANWEKVKKSVPYWVLGLVSPKIDEQEKDEKDSIVNLITLMNDFNKESEKNGKEKADDTKNVSKHNNKGIKEIENDLGNGALEKLHDQVKADPREENTLGDKASKINKESDKKK